MKALVFTTAYPNNVWPNDSVHVRQRVSQFAALDECSVKVVAPVPYFPPLKISQKWLFSQVARQEIIDGIEVYHPKYLMTPKVGMALYGLQMFLCALSTVRRVKRSFDFDLISAHTAYPEGLASVLLGAYFNKPVIVSARGSDINLLQTFPLIRQLLRFTLNKADSVIAVSDALKRSMIGLGILDSKISVIPNGVDVKKFHSFPKEEARNILGLGSQKLILSVGNLTANKGFDLLVKAVRAFRVEHPSDNIQLAIIGEGDCRKSLETLVASLRLGAHVRLVGAVPHERLYIWYSAADVFCLASEREGWPNVLMEALACGIPVIATPVGGIPEIIVSEEIGLLTERQELKIAAAIRQAFDKQWRREKIVQYVRAHTWERAALDMRNVFELTLACGKKRPAHGSPRYSHKVKPGSATTSSFLDSSTS